jgi:hypothetical protein
MKIEVSLKANRSLPGLLRLVGDDGKVLVQGLCLGKADGVASAKAGNPIRDPARPVGDTPTGEYTGRLLGWVPPPARSYGTVEPIVLDPTAGQALDAKQNGRKGLWIHGGDLTTGGFLRPTYGCIRLTPATHAAVVQAMKAAGVKQLAVEVREA